MRRLPLTTVICLVLVVGCYEEPVAITTFPPLRTPIFLTAPPSLVPVPTVPTVSPVQSTTPPTPPATPTPLATPTIAPPTASPTASSTQPATSGSPSPGCVGGWISPEPGSPEYEEALDVLEVQMGVAGPWSVTEMRYFVGPEVPWILSNPNPVERWYVRAGLVADPAFRGRWLLEKRSEAVKGIAAVASWGSTGYESPDWTGFFGEGPPQNYLGLPGQWPGIPYDFVTGAGDSENPGLPDEVVDCLAGT